VPLKGYCADTAVASFLGYDPSDTGSLADIDLFLGTAEDLVDAYCQTTFVQETGATKYFSGMGTNAIFPPHYIQSLTTVAQVDITDNNTVVYTFPDCVLKPNNAKDGAYRWIERWDLTGIEGPIAGIFPWGEGNIQITGNWGYPFIPNGVALATAMIVQHLFNARQYNEFLMGEASQGRTYSQNLAVSIVPTTASQLLAPYVNSQMLGVT